MIWTVSAFIYKLKIILSVMSLESTWNWNLRQSKKEWKINVITHMLLQDVMLKRSSFEQMLGGCKPDEQFTSYVRRIYTIKLLLLWKVKYKCSAKAYICWCNFSWKLEFIGKKFCSFHQCMYVDRWTSIWLSWRFSE